MEWSPALVWTCLLVARFTLARCSSSPPVFFQPPRLIGCVFIHRVNVTCHWEPGDTSATKYTLQVQRKPSEANSSLKTFTCITPDTSCTLGLNDSTSRILFCITITAHRGNQSISSHRPCQPGRIEVMLPPSNLTSIKPVHRSPRCLNVTWNRNSSDFPVSPSEIKRGELNTQIAIKEREQLNVQVRNVTVNGYSFLVCHLRPDTEYIIRLRHRYLGPSSPWSRWGKALQGKTREDAPSAAPVFWRQVKQTERNGWRHVSLLWKLLPHFLANGKVVFYNVTCQTESTQVLNDHGSCKNLHHLSTSCSLLLPPGRCFCTLTASTSAGTSPEAQISLPGATETESPFLSPITTRPLGDRSLEVHWKAPVDESVSRYVVEWFAVREKNSSILHWEKLNHSCTSVVITEGIKPMERYAVSVTALYGEQGAGKNTTLYTYTRQGTPSAGPDIKVQQISGGTVELSWSPVPVELLHGFLCNYTLYYTTINKPARSVFVPGHIHHYTLENLSPGNYDIFMQANTEAGAGVAGTPTNVHIGSEEISIVMYVIVPLMLTMLAMVLMGCLSHHRIVKKKLCQDVPDPSNSSLSRWTPKTTLESANPLLLPEKPAIKYSEVILLGELENSNPDQDHSCQVVCNLQTYSSPLGLRISGKTLTRSSATDLSPSSSAYSSVITKPHQNPPVPLLDPSCLQYNWQQNDDKSQLGIAREPFHSRQTPTSFLDISSISHSSVLRSHMAEISSLKHPFSQSSFNPPLQPNIFSHPSDRCDNFTPFLQFLPSISVDFSYCPVECDPYISYEA